MTSALDNTSVFNKKGHVTKSHWVTESISAAFLTCDAFSGGVVKQPT